MLEAARQFYTPVPPVSGTTPGTHTTWLSVPITATAHDMAAYTAMFGKYLDFYASGGKIWFSFSPVTATIDKSTAAGSTLANGTIATCCVPLVAETAITVYLDSVKHRWLLVQADSVTTTLIITPSSQAHSL